VSPVIASPASLIIGVAVTSLVLSTWYTVHSCEGYREVLLVSFIGSGVSAGLLAGLDATSVLLKVVPGCGITAMVLTTYGLKWVARSGADPVGR